MKFKIGKGIALREYLFKCIENEENGEWMIMEEREYSLSMLVYPVTLNDWNVEPEEYGRIEAEVLSQGNGYGNVMSVEQLMDVLQVLKQQKPNYTEQELEASLNYYSKRDAFLELKNT
jgi:hypothetical protein